MKKYNRYQTLSPLLVSMALLTTISPLQAARQRAEQVTGHAPLATPALDTLTPEVGDVVKAATNFSDPDGDTEDTTISVTTFRWQEETPTKSSLVLDKMDYALGSDIPVTDHPITGKAALLTTTAVTIPGATRKSTTRGDNGNGTYTAIYTASTTRTVTYTLSPKLKMSKYPTNIWLSGEATSRCAQYQMNWTRQEEFGGNAGSSNLCSSRKPGSLLGEWGGECCG